MLTAQQIQKLQTVELAQNKISDVVDLLEENDALTAKMLELFRQLQTEMDFEMMLIEDWS